MNDTNCMYDECTTMFALITSSPNVMYHLTSVHEHAQGLFTDSNSRLAQKTFYTFAKN